MKKESIFAFQSGSPIFQEDIFRRAYENSREVFGKVRVFWAPVPIYPLSIWSFIFVGEDNTPKRKVRRTFYSEDIHRTLFRLPPFIEELLNETRHSYVP